MKRTHETGAEAVSEGEQVPPAGTSTDFMAGRTGTGTRQVLVIVGATVIGWIAAVDEKPWWRWVWDAVSTWPWRGGWRVGSGRKSDRIGGVAAAAAAPSGDCFYFFAKRAGYRLQRLHRLQRAWPRTCRLASVSTEPRKCCL